MSTNIPLNVKKEVSFEILLWDSSPLTRLEKCYKLIDIFFYSQLPKYFSVAMWWWGNVWNGSANPEHAFGLLSLFEGKSLLLYFDKKFEKIQKRILVLFHQLRHFCRSQIYQANSKTDCYKNLDKFIGEGKYFHG